MKKSVISPLLRSILILIAVLPAVTINAQESYDTLLKNDPDSLTRIEPGDDPCLNYYKAQALIQKNYDYVTKHSDESGNGAKAYELWPFYPYLEKAARAGYPGAVDALYSAGVWGGMGGIESRPVETYQLLEEIEAGGNRDALVNLAEYHAFWSPDKAAPYAVKLAKVTELPKDANQAVACLSAAAGQNGMTLTAALVKADEVAAACSQPAEVYYKIYSEFQDRLTAVRRQAYFKKALDGGSPLACLEKGDFYYKGKIENLNLSKALEYYERAINAADDSFKENHGYEYRNLLWNAYRIRQSQGRGSDVNSTLDSLEYNYLYTLAGYSDSKAMIELGDRIFDTRFAADNWNDPVKNKKVYDQALEWYKKAESGDKVSALFKILTVYSEGDSDILKKSGSSESYVKKLKDINTFESVYYMAVYNWVYDRNENFARNWLNHYFKSYKGDGRRMAKFSDAILLYDEVFRGVYGMYDMNVAASVIHEDCPDDVKGEWVYGLSRIYFGEYTDGIKSLEHSIELAMEQGEITEAYYRLYELANLMQGKTTLLWSDKDLKLPVKYRKIARGRKLQKIAEANFYYPD